MQRAARLGMVGVAALVFSGCLVHVEHVDDPNAAFRVARAEAARLQGRPGPAHDVNVLVYDPADRELVRVSVPLWLVRKIDGKVDWDDELDGSDAGERLGRHLKRKLDLRDLEKAGLGVLVEVEEDDGEQVLVWLR